jgi:hypothetical protein
MMMMVKKKKMMMMMMMMMMMRRRKRMMMMMMMMMMMTIPLLTCKINAQARCLLKQAALGALNDGVQTALGPNSRLAPRFTSSLTT